MTFSIARFGDVDVVDVVVVVVVVVTFV